MTFKMNWLFEYPIKLYSKNIENVLLIKYSNVPKERTIRNQLKNK